MKSSRLRRRPIGQRRQERELFFWTAQEALRLVILAALTAYVVASVVGGQLPGSELLRYLTA